MEEEIKAAFISSGFTLDEEEEVLRKCLTFCINYSLSPSDLVSSWEVYYLNRLLHESTVQNAEMDGFLLHLQNEVKESVIREEPDLHMYSSKDVDMIFNNEDDYVKEETIGTPTNKLYSLSSEPFDPEYQQNGSAYFSSGKPSNVITPFGQRKEKFAVKFSVNQLPTEENGKEELDLDSEDDFLKKVKSKGRCSVLVHGTKPDLNCRFMYDRIEDRFNALESRIKRHSSSLVASGVHGEPVDPAVASQKSLFAVGMICCDGEGHLNDKSILLQSSSEQSGQRVRLDLQRLSQISTFPGQVVGVEGNNPSGHCLIASKIIDSIPLSVPADVSLHSAKRQTLDKENQLTDPSSADEELSVIIAAGPFTTTDNLFFEPLTELLAFASRKIPQLLILLGPFVDSEHPEIRRGSTDRTFDEIFHLEILRKLRDYVEYLGDAARVVLVPSIRDANHDFVFPQPGFDIRPADLNHQITNLTNPGIFYANQVKVGCCTVDVLKHLSGEEMSRNPSDGIPNDRMSRLAYHVLSQRSFYPLYPPAEDVPLDFSLAPETLHFSLIPDILILPSDMKYFVKVVSIGGRNEGEEQAKCICINPGRLAKGEGAGTFVELRYNGNPETASASVIGI